MVEYSVAPGARLIASHDRNSHGGPYARQDEEGDVPECLRRI